MEEDGVEFVNNFSTSKLSNDKEGKVVVEDGDKSYSVDALLMATGRKPNTVDVSAMPRGHVNGDLRGRFKVVLDEDGEKILGASFLGDSAEELINLIKMAMDHDIPASYLKNQIFTHPSMAENLNDLFNLK